MLRHVVYKRNEKDFATRVVEDDATGAVTQYIGDAVAVTATTNLTGGIEIGEAGGAAIALTASVMSIGDGHDETAINAALLANKKVRLVRNAVISTPIILNSGNTLELADGVIIKLADGIIHGPMLTNNAAATVIRQSAASISAGSNTLTDATISSTDVGRSVIVSGAGHGGTQSMPTLLCAVILTATNGSATLNAIASTTVSNAAAKYYDRDMDINVIGGHFDFNDGNNPGIQNSDGYYNSSHVTKFRRVDGLRLENMSFETTSGKYAICLADVTSYRVINPLFNTFSDGCHISGPARNGVVSGLRGKTGDDYIGVTARDYKYYADTQGDVVDLHISDVAMSNTSGGRLLLAGGPGHIVDNVRIIGLRGSGRGLYLGSGLDDVNCEPMFNSNIGSIYVEDISVACNSGYSEVHVKSESTQSIEVVDLKINDASNGHQYVVIERPIDTLIFRDSKKNISNLTTGQFVINVTSTATISNALISKCVIVSPATKYVNSLLNVAGIVDSIVISDVVIGNGSYSSSFNGLLSIATGASVGNVVVSNIIARYIKVLLQVGIGSAIGGVTLSGIRMKTCSRVVESSASLSIILDNIYVSTPYSEAINILAGATLTVCGSGGYFDPSKDGVSRAGGEVVRVMNIDFPVDSAKVATNAGDRHYNTNVASGALKVGPCVYSGAAWKSLLNIA